MSNPIDNILTEWAYRVHDGMPDPKDNYHVVQLEEYLNELRLPRRVVKRVLEKVRKYKDDNWNKTIFITEEDKISFVWLRQFPFWLL